MIWVQFHSTTYLMQLELPLEAPIFLPGTGFCVILEQAGTSS